MEYGNILKICIGDLMNVDEARRLQDNFYNSRKDEIDALLEKVYNKIRNAASNGFDRVSIDFDEIGCPINFKRAILNDLHNNGFKTEITFLDCVIRW